MNSAEYQQLVARIRRNADLIAERTPVDSDWDDIEDWCGEAAELARDVIELLDAMEVHESENPDPAI